MILSITGLALHLHSLYILIGDYFSSLSSDLVVALCYNLWDCIGILPGGFDFI